MLWCQGVSKTFSSPQGDIEALRQVDLRAEAGEFVCLIGPSGCGKTTLLRLIAGLIPPTSGQILRPTGNGNGPAQTSLVFQEGGLFPWMTVLDNVAFGLEMRGVPGPLRQKRAMDFLAQVGLDGFVHHFPHQLSAGMRQRAALIRSFVTDAPVLLMDEPFASLDTQMQWILEEELLRIWREHRKTIVYVTHDVDEALRLSDRLLVLTARPGQICYEYTVPPEYRRSAVGKNETWKQEVRQEIWQLIRREVERSLLPN